MRKFFFFMNRQLTVMKKSILFNCISTCLVFSAVIITTAEDMCQTYEATKSCAFAVIMAAVWSGLFNTLCLFHEDSNHILPEIRAGIISPCLYVTANILIQLMLTLMQALIATIAFSIFDYDRNGLLLPNATAEIFLTFLLTLFSSATLGFAASTLITSIMSAISSVPVILIIQLLLCNGIFSVSESLEPITNYVIAKYGFSAFGSILDINKYELKIMRDNPDLSSVISITPNPIFNHSAEHLMKCWYHLSILSLMAIFVAAFVIRCKASKKK